MVTKQELDTVLIDINRVFANMNKEIEGLKQSIVDLRVSCKPKTKTKGK